MLAPIKTLFLGGGDYASVLNQGCRTVMEYAIYA
jgi:hypothetical protein